MDTDLITLPWGEKRLVLGMMMLLTAKEVTSAKRHIARLASDAQYKAISAHRTINEETGKPEIMGAKIFDLEDAAEGKIPLLHEDQLSLFKVVHEHFKSHRPITRRRKRDVGLRHGS
jgi:hypothetical protein